MFSKKSPERQVAQAVENDTLTAPFKSGYLVWQWLGAKPIASCSRKTLFTRLNNHALCGFNHTSDYLPNECIHVDDFKERDALFIDIIYAIDIAYGTQKIPKKKSYCVTLEAETQEERDEWAVALLASKEVDMHDIVPEIFAMPMHDDNFAMPAFTKPTSGSEPCIQFVSETVKEWEAMLQQEINNCKEEVKREVSFQRMSKKVLYY